MADLELVRQGVSGALEKLPEGVLPKGMVTAIVQSTPDNIMYALADIPYKEPVVALPEYMQSIYYVLGWRTVLKTLGLSDEQRRQVQNAVAGREVVFMNPNHKTE